MDRRAYLDEIDRVIAQGKYKDTWQSLGQYVVPAWYEPLKFGIFIHWGVYSVPAFGNEWYPRNMYIKDSPEYAHHIKTYGKHADFGYKDFIPLFKAEKFDADAWAALFRDAGAQYVIPVAEHHDGFQMYDSELSKWNAAKMGPKRDVIGEVEEACEKLGMMRGVSSHRVEHWFFMGGGRTFDSDIHPPMKLGDFYWPSFHEKEDSCDVSPNGEPTQEFLEDWLLRCCELVDKYRPRILYFDWWIFTAAVKPYLRKFAAYYYNRAEEWGTGAVINYKLDSFAFGTAVPDVERGQYAAAKPYLWQSDTAIAKNSWCYTENNKFKSPDVILRDLIDVVAKNGRFLLNVGPKPDGTFTKEDESVLRAIGRWLRTNGEAIYDSHVWRIACEGPTEVKEGQFTDGEDKAFTREDIRFTCRGDSLYAVFLQYPEDGHVVIKSCRASKEGNPAPFDGVIRDVSLLGTEEKVIYERKEDGLHITAKASDPALPVVFRIRVE